MWWRVEGVKGEERELEGFSLSFISTSWVIFFDSEWNQIRVFLVKKIRDFRERPCVLILRDWRMVKLTSELRISRWSTGWFPSLQVRAKVKTTSISGFVWGFGTASSTCRNQFFFILNQLVSKNHIGSRLIHIRASKTTRD